MHTSASSCRSARRPNLIGETVPRRAVVGKGALRLAGREEGSGRFASPIPGRGAVWLARLTGGQEVGGSNPLGPTGEVAGQGPLPEVAPVAFRSVGPTGTKPKNCSHALGSQGPPVQRRCCFRRARLRGLPLSRAAGSCHASKRPNADTAGQLTISLGIVCRVPRRCGSGAPDSCRR